MKKNVLSCLLAAVLLLSLLLGLSSCGNTDYFYCTSDMRRYVDLSEEDVLGLTLELALPFDEYTDEDALRELEHLRLVYATYDTKNGAGDSYVGAPGYGDTAYIYFELATDAAFENTVTSNLYTSDGTRTVLIGYWQFPEDLDEYLALFDNQAVSDALMELEPASRRTDGVVAEGDNIRVSYTATDKDGKTLSTFHRRRVDLSAPSHYEASLVSALIGAPIGEKQSVTVEDAEKGPVTYDFTVEFAVEENYTSVAVELPQDAFDETYREDMQALNGKKVYLRMSIDSYVDYTVEELNRDFLVNTLKLNSDETDLDKLIAEAIAVQKQNLEQERLPEVKELAMLAFMEQAQKVAVIKKYPSKLFREQMIATVDELTEEYWADKQAAVDGKYKFNVSLNEYAAIRMEYELTEYPTLQDYAYANAQSVIGDRLVMFAVAQICGEKVSKKELKELYEGYVDALTESTLDNLVSQYLSSYMEKESVSEAEALEKLGGKEAIRKMLIEEKGGYDELRQAVVVSYGGETDLLWYTLLTVTYGATTDYIFENTTWNYVYLGADADAE